MSIIRTAGVNDVDLHIGARSAYKDAVWRSVSRRLVMQGTAAPLPYNGSVTRIALLLSLIASIGFSQTPREGNKPFPPYRVIGNIYYVGADDIASYLIVTPKGHIILNSGYEDTPALIRKSVEKLGFKITGVKILLNSQAHFDHVPRQATLQKMTGAQVYSSEREVGVLESGGKTDSRYGKEVTYPPVHVDHAVHDGEHVTLGDVTLTAHL